LRFRRPTEYEAEMKIRRVEGSRILPRMDLNHIKMCKAGSTFVNTFNKLFFSGFSPDLEEENIYDVLCTFGRLKAFVLATDKQTNRSRGFGHC
jgi:RNA recognition motif-containing protein